MGEELPLDPNQVESVQEEQVEQQPQDGEPGQVVQPNHEGDQPTEDETQPDAEPDDSPAASDGGDETKQSDSIDHGDNDSTQLTPEEEIWSPERVRNQDKAEVMAHAQDDFLDERKRANRSLGYSTAYYDKPRSVRKGEETGREYEVAAVAKLYNITPEQAAEQMRSDTTAFLEYGHAIAENHKKYNDKIGPSLEVVETVHDFVDQHPNALDGGVKYQRMTEDGKFVDQFVEVTISNDAGVLAFKIKDTSKEHHKRLRELSTGVFEGVTYKITEYSRDGVGFSVETIKTKELDFDFDQERYLSDFKEELSRIKDYVEPKRAPPQDEDEEDDEHISYNELMSRARASGMNDEEAHEAATLYPGDLM